jgi:hypothetical protein
MLGNLKIDNSILLFYYQTMSLANAGKQWTDEEQRQLLSDIYRKKSLKEIAAEHQRTAGAIKAQLKKMAADYWFNDWRPIDEIVRFTGLTVKEVETAIKVRFASNSKSHIGDDVLLNSAAEMKEEIAGIKEDIKEIKRLINAIYEFETS